MKAEWEDAPARVKPKRRRIPPFKVSIIAAAMVFGITDYLAKERGWMHGWLKKTFPSDATKHLAAQPPAVAPPPKSSHNPEEMLWQEVESERSGTEIQQQPKLRQTVFNDQNYTPRRDINAVELRHTVRAGEEASRRRSEHTRHVSSTTLNGTSNAHFTWRDARGRVTQWHTSYTYQYSKIDNTTFCRDYGSGSIEYRNCRKAAQQWLKKRCGNANNVQDEWQRMHCLAYNGFRT